MSHLITTVNIKPGMLVKLKSGSPVMTADHMRDKKMMCMWFVGDQPRWIDITPEALIEVSENEIHYERNARPSDTD